MGIWRDHLLPRLVDKALDNEIVEDLRRRSMEGLSGEVVELGFGSGLNVPLYPEGVTRVHAIEPASVGRKLAAKRVAASPVEVEYSGLDGERLPLASASVDGAVSTFTLCTIDDVQTALAEVRRVLRPGGALYYCEHGLAPDAGVVTWQRRIEPLQRLICGGCRLTRPIETLLTDAGFTLERPEADWVESLPKYVGYTYLGVART